MQHPIHHQTKITVDEHVTKKVHQSEQAGNEGAAVCDKVVKTPNRTGGGLEGYLGGGEPPPLSGG